MAQWRAQVRLVNTWMSKARFLSGMPTLNRDTGLYKIDFWRTNNMKLRSRGMLVLCALLITTMASNHNAQSQSEKTTVISKPGAMVEGLQFTAVPSKPKFAVDEPVLVTLEITTNKSQPTSFGDNNSPVKAFKIVLTDAGGNTVPFTRYGKLVESEPTFSSHFSYANRAIEVRPGYKLEYHFWINRMYDMTIPGDYHITFSRSGIVTSNVISNVAIIKVVESGKFNTPKTNLDLPTAEPL